MYVRYLTVADFRSWGGTDLALEAGTNVLIGSNGQGKTNLVEAIGYLSTLGSHRVGTDAPLIRRGCERAVVRAAVVSEGRELRLEVELAAGRGNKARINNNPVPRPRELIGLLRTVLFAPEDLAIVRGDPTERRRFLDELLVQSAPRYAGVRADYDRVLKQRAALLKSAGALRRSGRSVELSTLDFWDAQLAEHGAQLVAGRLQLLDALAPLAALAYASVARASDPFRLGYVCSNPRLDASERDVKAIGSAMLDQLAQVRAQELERGANLIGPHRDDVELHLGELPVRGFASHGESWSAALALRLGSYELLRGDGAEPVLLLDDVFAELDVIRREQLALVAGKAEQVILTAAVASDVPDELTGARYDVAGGEVRRVL